MKQEPRPPSLPRRLIAWRLRRHHALEALDDLDELFQVKAETRGPRVAIWWYWRQLPSFLFVRFGLGERPRASSSMGIVAGSVRQNVVLALRQMRRAPAFTALVVGTLAVGIGTATALGSIVYPILWRPLGYPSEERIVRVWPERHVTQEQFDHFHQSAQSFDAFSGILLDTFTLTGEGEPVVIRGAVVTTEHFETFGLSPVRGRDFEPEDSLPGSEPVAVVSHALWQSRFGGREDILGERIELGGSHGALRTIVGVAPAGFQPLGAPNLVWVPVTVTPNTDAYRDMANLRVIARLAPGRSLDEAAAELATLAASLEPPPPFLGELSGYSVVPLSEALVGSFRPTLLALLGAVGLVFLLCCANVASLLLVRNRAREREITVRRALGASGGHLLRQWLTENAVLAALSGVVAISVVWLLYPSIAALVPDTFPRSRELGAGVWLTAIGLMVSLAATFLVSIVPLARSSMSPSGAALGSRAVTAERSRTRWNQTLVSGEIALSLALVVACGLLAKSFVKLSRVETGFSAPNAAVVRVSPSTLRYEDEARRKNYFREAVGAVGRIPTVEASGAIQLLPLTSSFMAVGYSPSGALIAGGESPPFASYRIVTPGYRRALGIPLIAGRDLDVRDRAHGQPVGLVNETLAKTLLPPGDAIGRMLHFEDGSEWFTIVGVIGDVHQQKLDRSPSPEVYLPLEQDAWPTSLYLVASATEGVPLSELAPSLRAAIWSVDRDVPLSEIRPMAEVVSASLTTERTRTAVFVFFALLAFLLSASGVYGIVAYTVSERTREIGVRMAFGASGARVVSETLVRNAKALTYGLVAGTVFAGAASRGLSSLLYDVPTTDASVYLGAIALLTTVALTAGFVPARRASLVDPLVSLRLDD